MTTVADGSNVTAITTGPALDSRPVFSRDGTRIAFLRKESECDEAVVANADGTGQLRFRRNCSTTSTPSTGPRTGSSDGPRRPPPKPRSSMSILVLAADGTGSAEPIEVGEVNPQGWAAWRPPAGDEIVFRGHPTVDDPAVALYAVAPGGGTPRILSEPIGPPSSIRRSIGPPSRPMGERSRTGAGGRMRQAM